MSTFSSRTVRSPRVKSLAAALSVALAGGATIGGLFESGMASASAHVQRTFDTQKRQAMKPKSDFNRVTVALRGLTDTSPRPLPSRAATTRMISSSADSGAGSLRDALASAVDGDIIDLSNVHGTITLTHALQPAASVAINGPGANVLTLNGNGLGRVIESGHTLKLSNVTIANGAVTAIAASAPAFGGCLAVNGDLSLYNTTITGCSVGDAATAYSYGGAIAVVGALSMKYSTVSNSTATAYLGAGGGGIFNVESTSSGSTIAYSTISGNTAQLDATNNDGGYFAQGGGALIASTTSTSLGVGLLKATVTGNSAYAPASIYLGRAAGGGVAIFDAGSVALYSTFSGNSAKSYSAAYGGGLFATGNVYALESQWTNNAVNSGYFFAYGGGIATYNSTVSVAVSTVSGNTVTSDCYYCTSAGGGVFGIAGVAAKYSTISGNSVTATFDAGGAFGGGISGRGAGITLSDSTVSGNSVANTYGTSGFGGFGGGVAPLAAPLTAYNSTIAFNSSSDLAGGIAAGYGSTTKLISTIVSNNIASYDATSADIQSPDTTLTITGDHTLAVNVGANITMPADTLVTDPLLGPLADNGGPTLTHKLDAASPAVDTGSNPNGLTWDQRGPAHDRSFGQAPDIGAYELDTDRIFHDGFEQLNFNLAP